MEQLTNTLLPARMFVVCCVYSYGKGLKRAKAKSKCLLFLASSYCAELEAAFSGIQWNGILLEMCIFFYLYQIMTFTNNLYFTTIFY
jgi:hypothetical protein